MRLKSSQVPREVSHSGAAALSLVAHHTPTVTQAQVTSTHPSGSIPRDRVHAWDIMIVDAVASSSPRSTTCCQPDNGFVSQPSCMAQRPCNLSSEPGTLDCEQPLMPAYTSRLIGAAGGSNHPCPREDVREMIGFAKGSFWKKGGRMLSRPLLGAEGGMQCDRSARAMPIFSRSRREERDGGLSISNVRQG